MSNNPYVRFEFSISGDTLRVDLYRVDVDGKWALTGSGTLPLRLLNHALKQIDAIDARK